MEDRINILLEVLSEDEIVEQLIKSMEKSNMGVSTPASAVSQWMREKYLFLV